MFKWQYMAEAQICPMIERNLLKETGKTIITIV